MTITEVTIRIVPIKPSTEKSMARWPNSTIIYDETNSKPIPFYDGYRLTNEFRIVGKTGRLLSEIDTNNTGYKFVNVRVNGKQNILYVHRAVALVHVEGYFDGAYVDHIDDNPFNYHPSNLRWVTPMQNSHFVKNKYTLKNTQARIRKLELILDRLRKYEKLLLE